MNVVIDDVDDDVIHHVFGKCSYELQWLLNDSIHDVRSMSILADAVDELNGDDDDDDDDHVTTMIQQR